MIKQNTPEWLEMRKNKVGASDAPAIMGVSPYKTAFQLWEEKMSTTMPTQNYVMKRGHDLERIARVELEIELEMPLIPSIKLSTKRSWMMASLDAMSLDERVIAEIKCPGAEDHNLALLGQVPEKYFPQLQHQLEVCDLEMVYYYSFDGEKGKLLKVYRDDKYIKTLLKQEEKFYEYMQNFEAPPLCDRDYQAQSSPQWLSLADRWRSVSSTLKQLEDEEKELREQLVAQCNGQNSTGAGIKVSKCIRKGNVEYAKVPELMGVDLNPYRKKACEYWRVS